jgi:prevent-host-death family protein
MAALLVNAYPWIIDRDVIVVQYGSGKPTRGLEGVQEEAMHKLKTLGAIDLRDGIVPITKAAASLSELIRRVQHERAHIVLTQNGKSVAVILAIDEYVTMRDLAEQQLNSSDNRQD